MMVARTDDTHMSASLFIDCFDDLINTTSCADRDEAALQLPSPPSEAASLSQAQIHTSSVDNSFCPHGDDLVRDESDAGLVQQARSLSDMAIDGVIPDGVQTAADAGEESSELVSARLEDCTNSSHFRCRAALHHRRPTTLERPTRPMAAPTFNIASAERSVRPKKPEQRVLS